MGKEDYNVFHMLPCSSIQNDEPQLRKLKATADVDLAIVDLVGDLAAYRPSGKVVIFEGGGDSDFDRKVTGALFPELQAKANLISGSNKARVRALHETLETASQQGHLPFTFFAVTDKDSQKDEIPSTSIGVFSWDVYHIENYFLEVAYIKSVLKSLGIANLLSDEEVLDELRSFAASTLPQLIRHELSQFANAALVGVINTGTDPKKGDLAAEIHAAVIRSVQKIEDQVQVKLTIENIRSVEKQLRTGFESNLADGSWIKTFKGRDILRRFAGKWASSVQYEAFRNLILSRMQDDGFQPQGMKKVVDQILSKP